MSKEFVSSDSESLSEDEKPKKKQKTKHSKESKESKPKASGSGDNDNMFDLTRMKFATVSEFKGKKYVNIREYYEKDEKMLPGRKGIALNEEQWRKLKKRIADIDEALEDL